MTRLCFQATVMVALYAVLVSGVASAQSAPISEEQVAQVRRVLSDVSHEQTPPTSRFYFRSNEWRQDVLVPHLRALGGALVGVGGDQLYTMAAQAGSELIISTDFDRRIAWLHRLYGPLLISAATPAEFVGRFSPSEEQATQALIRRELAADPDVEEMVAHYVQVRAAWFAYLHRVRMNHHRGERVGWLGRQQWYDHVRRLHREGRVMGRTADLTSPQVLPQVGRALREAGVVVRLVYFSNAEQFFVYSPDFIRNMSGLPTDERTQVVRTIRNRVVLPAEGGRWHFMVHQFADFIERMQSGHYPRSFAMVADLVAAGPPHRGRYGISTMNTSTPRTLLERAARAASPPAPPSP